MAIVDMLQNSYSIKDINMCRNRISRRVSEAMANLVGPASVVFLSETLLCLVSFLPLGLYFRAPLPMRASVLAHWLNHVLFFSYWPIPVHRYALGMCK